MALKCSITLKHVEMIGPKCTCLPLLDGRRTQMCQKSIPSTYIGRVNNHCSCSQLYRSPLSLTSSHLIIVYPVLYRKKCART